MLPTMGMKMKIFRSFADTGISLPCLRLLSMENAATLRTGKLSFFWVCQWSKCLDLLSFLANALSFYFCKIRQILPTFKVPYGRSIYFSLQIFRIFLHDKADFLTDPLAFFLSSSSHSSSQWGWSNLFKKEMRSCY